jgi:heme/copper-type cytochrome/quinol oxidase subunit 1
LTLFNSNVVSLVFTSPKQLRILNNWRDLKLNREGWRCRMLVARHQRSLYRRYVNEADVIWIVEKNAKDLLPGWAMITPFSSRLRYTLVGKVDIGVSILVVTLTASMIASANFLITYRYLSTLNNRKMRDARSFFTEAVISASWMMVAANPMLILGLLMLISDRHWRTCFFDYSGGGDTILFQHMFWFFGHPEVYIIIIPCFGITNTLLSFYLRKRISARASLMYSLYTIAFLGFFVWGHHMYMVGLSHTTRMLYSTLTVMISVPAATKIMHWLVTFVNSSVHFEIPFILTLCFIFYFVSGGISGMAVAHTGMDVLFHDTFYVIGHFHVLFAGSLMFAGFSAFYFYLPSLFGVKYNRFFTYLHVFYYSFGQIFTVIPMIWLGYLGMPRRVLDYPSAMGGWHSLISSAHVITISGILAFVIMLFESLRKKKSYVIKTFGVGRYNVRLNFYLYQISRNRYWLAKHLTILSFWKVLYSYNRGLSFETRNDEVLETQLVYYTV